VHVLSNTALGDEWPKTRTARAGIERLLREGAAPEALFDLLAERGSGRGDDRYRSAHFIEGPIYGTRSSAVVTIDAAGLLTFVERSFDSAARLTGEVREHLELGRS
jgi:uncharacterized protein with NRDE domain